MAVRRKHDPGTGGAGGKRNPPVAPRRKNLPPPALRDRPRRPLRPRYKRVYA